MEFPVTPQLGRDFIYVEEVSKPLRTFRGRLLPGRKACGICKLGIAPMDAILGSEAGPVNAKFQKGGFSLDFGNAC